MDGASRHAQRLANDFLNDLDEMQRNSRARDRRAMSHLEIGARTGNWFPTRYDRRHSTTNVKSHSSPTGESVLGSARTYYYPRSQVYSPSSSRFVSHPSPSVMLIGKSTSQWTEPRYYSTNLSQSNWELPTASLRAHSPPRPILTPRARDYVDNILSSRRRRSWNSHVYGDDFEEPVSRTVYRTYASRPPTRTYSRLSSVPPVSTYRPVYYTTEMSTPSVSLPRTYYRTSRYVTETPYYLSPYSTRIGEPSRPILTTHYSTAPAPVTQRSTYYYPGVTTTKQYYTPIRTVSYSNMIPEVQYERRRIERRMDDLLDYKLPSPDYYREMRGSLRGLHDKMDEHRRLLDRYAGVDMDAVTTSVGDRIESKYLQLANRMGRGSSVMARA